MIAQRNRLPHYPFRLQFSLRSLLVAVSFAGVISGAINHFYVRPFQAQKKTAELIRNCGGHVVLHKRGPAWLRDWISEEALCDVVHVDLPANGRWPSCWDRVTRLPRLKTLRVRGECFDNSHLKDLRCIETLEGVILDSTYSTTQAIESLRSERQDCLIFESDDIHFKRLDARGASLFANIPPNEVYTLFSHLSDFACGRINTVTFHRSPCSDVDVAGMLRLKGLEALGVRHGDISDKSVEFLEQMHGLKYLDLTGTKVTTNGVARIRRRLPNCKVQSP